MIGYLTSNSYGVGFPEYVRNFNVNFLALPALPSVVLANVSSTSDVVVRRIDTPSHGTWYALVNTGMTPHDKVQVRLPGVRRITCAVSGKELTADGAVSASFYPFELKAWRAK